MVPAGLGGAWRGLAVSPAITQPSRPGRTLPDQGDLTCGFAPVLEQLDAHGRSLQPVPCGTQSGTQDEYGGIVGAVDPVLQGLLTHPATLPTL